MSIESQASSVAKYFVKATDLRVTRAIMAKTVNQAKSLLNHGYTEQEIIEVINHIIARGTSMYSLGYVNTCINNVLHELNEIKQKQTKTDLKQTIRQMVKQEKVEVKTHKSNNRNKSSKFGLNDEHKYDSIFWYSFQSRQRT